MNKNSMRKLLSFVLCIVLIAAMALLATGCSDKTKKGEGEISFNFEVTDLDGNTTKFLVKTDKTIVGDALLEEGLIAGDPGPYGLYVKTVNGITADYDKDGSYWAFYTNGEYALKGVDQTEIDTTATYAFVQTKD